MADRVAGVEILGQTIRVVETIRTRRRVRITRAIDQPAPFAAVESGEILDADAVAETLRDIWAEHGLKARRVVMGIDGRQAVVRSAVLPRLPAGDLRSALQFDIGELLRFPVQEAVLDHVVLGTGSSTDVRLLAVAIHESVPAEAAALLSAAGLRLERVDLLPLASIRSAAVFGTASGEEAPQTEAVVNFGPETTMVTVHTRGVPEFVRILAGGATVGAASLSDELESQLATIASFRGGDVAAESGDAIAVDPRLRLLLDGVIGTLDYYAQQEGPAVERVVVAGDDAGLPGLVETLGSSVSVPMVSTSPSDGWPAEVPFEGFETCLGLALAGSDAHDPTGLTLIPEADVTRRLVRRQRVIGIAAAAALALVAFGDAHTRWSEASALEEDAAVEERSAEVLSRRLDELADLIELHGEAVIAQTRVSTLLEDELAWERVLGQVAEAMPDEAFLTALRVERLATAEQLEGIVSGAEIVATMSFSGVAPHHDKVAEWLTRVGRVPALTEPWLSQSALGPYGLEEEIYAIFTANAALLPGARSERPHVWEGQAL